MTQSYPTASDAFNHHFRPKAEVVRLGKRSLNVCGGFHGLATLWPAASTRS